jgi:FtsZ-binding cell division protein ZapB
MTYEIKTLPLSAIRTNGGTQTRVQLNAAAVKEYGEAMTEGVHFPPVIVFFDGTDHWLADGFHRVQASMDIGALSITSEVRPGDQRAARLFSTGANGAHGVPPTVADKRRAVMTMLNDAEWATWSDRDVSRQCKVSHPFVAKMRASLETKRNPIFPDSRPESHLETFPDSPAETVKKVSRGGKAYEMKTDGVSKANKARATPADEPTVATPPERHDEAPGPVKASKASGSPEVAELMAIIADLKAKNEALTEEVEALREVAAGADETLKELVLVQAIVDANPPLAEAVAKAKQLSAEVFSLRESNRALQSETNEAIRLCKAAQRRADRLEKAAREHAA